MGPIERGETYAESVLEGKELPSHERLRAACDLTSYGSPDAHGEIPCGANATLACDKCEGAITADMGVLRSWLAMAFAMGYQAAEEDRGRRSATGGRVRK